MNEQDAIYTYQHVADCQNEIKAIIHKYTRLANCGLMLGEKAINDAGEYTDETIAELFAPYLRDSRQVLNCTLDQYKAGQV